MHRILLDLLEPVQTDQLVFLSGGLEQRYELASAFLKGLHSKLARGPETS